MQLLFGACGCVCVRISGCNATQTLLQRVPHRPRLDVPRGARPAAAAPCARPDAQDGQPHGHRLPRRGPRRGQHRAGAAGNVEIQPDLPALSRGKSLQDAKNFGVKTFQYLDINKDPDRHFSINFHLGGEQMQCRAKTHSSLLPAFWWEILGVFFRERRVCCKRKGL